MNSTGRAPALALAALLLVAGGGCFGPNKLSGRMGDHLSELYVDSPWLWGNTVSWSVITVVMNVTWSLDGLINAYFFWITDAWPLGDGVGSYYEHRPPALPDGG